MRPGAHRGQRMPSSGRILRLGVSALGLGVATIAGAALGGGTFAMLSSRAVAPGGTVSAGTAELRINGTTEASLGDIQASPSSPGTRAFTIENTGDAELMLAIATAGTGGALADVARIRITPIDVPEGCAPGLSGPLVSLANFHVQEMGGIVPEETRAVCLEVDIPVGTAAELSGQTVDFRLELVGAQVEAE